MEARREPGFSLLHIVLNSADMKLLGSDTGEPDDDGLPTGEVAIRVTVPEQYLGTTIGELNAHRGSITAIEKVGALQAVLATLPASLFKSLVEHVTGATEQRAVVQLQDPQP